MAELAGIAEAVEFLSQDAFTFAGRQSAPPQPFPPAAAPQPNGMTPLVAQLQQFLYAYCYTRPFRGAALDPKPPDNPVDSELVSQLSRANTSRDIWDDGWVIYDFLQSGQTLVQKQNLFRVVWPGEFISRDLYAKAPQPGTSVSISMPRESRSVQPGFYFALGETPADQQDDYSVVRFYWNLRHTGAPALVRSLTTEFNRFQIPFRFKCPSHRIAYDRVDSSILYVGKRFYRIAADVVAGFTPALAPYLDDETPLFTKRLARGLAMAEDTGSQESFGMSRCRMLAQGLWNAYVQGSRGTDAKMQLVEQEFARNQVSLERPYLSPGSADVYEYEDLAREQAA